MRCADWVDIYNSNALWAYPLANARGSDLHLPRFGKCIDMFIVEGFDFDLGQRQVRFVLVHLD